MSCDILILGAGMAGLAAARKCVELGYQTTLIDKGRGVGGRVATRRSGPPEAPIARWDHGPQFVDIHQPDLLGQLVAWGLNLPESSDLNGLSGWCPAFGINSLAKTLSKGLNILRSQRIIKISSTAEGWEVFTNQGDIYHAPHLLVTFPVPQFLELATASELELTEQEWDILNSVEYERCLTLLAEMDGPSGLDSSGEIHPAGGILQLLQDQKRKGISPGHSLVAQASPAFSLEWYDRNRMTAAAVMRAAVQEKIQSRITTIQIHGWKYARAIRRIQSDFLPLSSGLLLAGDSFNAGNSGVNNAKPDGIACALQSGLAAAAHLTEKATQTMVLQSTG